ncbi:MAG: glutaredoxin domain-containing protein [Oligoflexia bacterium]|nr:glutaredoxin domain-containing protein [Oligoflexia bacterium]
MSTQVTVYTMQNCPYCLRAKELLKRRDVAFKEVLVPMDDDAQWDALEKRSGMKTMPQIFAGDRLIGGYSELAEQDGKDQLVSLK